MAKVRVYVTLNYDKSVVDATKRSEIRKAITDELNAVASDAFSEFSPSEFKIRFVRNKKTKVSK